MELRLKGPFIGARLARDQGMTLVKILSGEMHPIPHILRPQETNMQFILHVEDVVSRKKFYTAGPLNFSHQLERYCRNLFYPEEIQGLFLEARMFEIRNTYCQPMVVWKWHILGT